jgi:predicted secreted hydrolase
MKVEHLLKNKKETTHSKIKGILSFFIIIVMITPIIPVQAEINKDHDHPEVYWKHYPYQPPGTEIIFPSDEGSHDVSEFRIEWWYANFHLTGQTTGKEYGSFVAFYKIQSSVAERKEVRIFSISDIASQETYNNVQIGSLIASNDHLDLRFEYIANDNNVGVQTASKPDIYNLISENKETMNSQYSETIKKSSNQITTMGTTYADTIQKTNPIGNYDIDHQESSEGLVQYDHWYTKYNDQGLLPFQYTLVVSGNSQQDSKTMELAVDMNCLKQPLIVGDDGLIYFEDDDFSYYYSLTRLLVTGKITVHGVTEEVSGNAWIDHQWGNFVNQNPPPWGLAMTYEWFSIQLQNNQEIVVGDMWDRETNEKLDQSYTDGLNLINSDGSLNLLKDYTITPLDYWNESNDQRFYSRQWHITESSKDINLIVTPVFFNQLICFKENYQLLQQILEELFPGACFWEGVCIVSGTINGISVDGKAYVELTHYYESIKK